MELAIQIQVEELPEGLFLATSEELILPQANKLRVPQVIYIRRFH